MVQHILIPEDSAYPSDLEHAHPPPEQLYYEGDISLLNLPSISIIGSRKMSAYGQAVLNLLVPAFVRAGLIIVSGLAYGVDVAAHRRALAEKGRCVAVLGSGLDVVYPSAHLGTYREIIENGCCLTEYPAGTQPYPGNFPARNRIVAALSPVVLIIEAGERSGTLSTARHAHEMGRTICVVPGDILREQSKGVNTLLKEGATPVTAAEDVLQFYGAELKTYSHAELHPALTGSPRFLYDCILRGPTTVEGLLKETNWDISRLYSTLSILEIDGYITCNQQQWLTTSSS